MNNREVIEVNARVVEKDKASIFIGIAFVVAGLLLALIPGIGIGMMTFLAGICIMCSGVVDIATFVRFRKLMVVSPVMVCVAVVDLLVGLLCVLHPINTGYSILWIVIIGCLVYAGVEAFAAYRAKTEGLSTWLGFAGFAFLGLAGGILLIVLGEPILRICLGIYVLVQGIELINYGINVAKN